MILAMTDEEIIASYEPWLRRTARAMAGPSNPVRDDLIQEGRIALWKALRSYLPELGPRSAWLMSKARYGMLNVVQGRPQTGQPARNHGPHASGEPRKMLSLDGELRGETGYNNTDGAELAYHRAEIAAALAGLSNAQRRYVMARFWLDMTSAEMSAVVFGYDPSGLWNSPKNGAKHKLRKSLAHLADSND